MDTILSIMIIAAIGWVGFLIFILPILTAAKGILIAWEDNKNAKDTR